VVITDKHFVRLDDFDVATVFDALIAALSCIRKVHESDPPARYHFIAWNYLPSSGGSLVHPHLQCNTGYYPTTYQKRLLDSCRRYQEERGTNFWSDLLEQERKSGERYIGETGNIRWLTSFVPRGRLSDILAVFPGKSSILEFAEEDLHDLAQGLLRVFGYLDEIKVPGFNLATYSGFNEGQFWAHARVTPRSLLLYSPIETSDRFYYQLLHDENICILPPETAASMLRKYFQAE
jgi:galactose-1-phosphate uridylyltransferase